MKPLVPIPDAVEIAPARISGEAAVVNFDLAVAIRGKACFPEANGAATVMLWSVACTTVGALATYTESGGTGKTAIDHSPLAGEPKRTSPAVTS